MSFMTWIVSRLNYLGDFFYELYLDCYYAGWPLEILDTWFYAICELFYSLAWDFYDFSEWVNTVQARIVDILSWSTIWSYILSYVPNLLEIRDWFYYWWENVTSVVVEWWPPIYQDIKDLIAIATQGFNDLVVAWDNFWKITFPEWTGKLDNLKASWDYFWTVTLPNLVSLSWLTTWWASKLLDIDKLINDTLKIWFPFYDDLVALWNDIKLFFTDPEDWLYKSLDRIIERFW